MNNERSHFNNIVISSEPDIPRIKHLLKIGLAAGIMVLIGDMLLGYGATDVSVYGIPAAFARFLTVSDWRIFLAAILGLIGIPLECLCYFAVYRLIASKSEKYAHIYRAGILGCLIFGGCGVHVPCCAAAYFMKKIFKSCPDKVFDLTAGFAAYFLTPAAVLFLVFFLILSITQIKAFREGLTPLPRWTWIFSILIGLPLAVVFKLPNEPLTNALAAGWISLGNIWMFGGLLAVVKKSE